MKSELELLSLKSINSGTLLGIKETKKYISGVMKLMKEKSGIEKLSEEQIHFIIDQMYTLHKEQFENDKLI